MSEPIWCEIQLTVPLGWVGHIAHRIQYFDIDVEVIQNEDPIVDVQITGEGNYGLADSDLSELLEWLREHHVPFVAADDTKYEFPGQTVVNSGFREWTGPNPVALDCTTYGHIKSGTHPDFKTPEDFFRLMSQGTHDFNIDHLGAWPPPDPDERLTFDECERAGVDGTLRQIGAT